MLTGETVGLAHTLNLSAFEISPQFSFSFFGFWFCFVFFAPRLFEVSHSLIVRSPHQARFLFSVKTSNAEADEGVAPSPVDVAKLATETTFWKTSENTRL